jgi:hypothetical protein
VEPLCYSRPRTGALAPVLGEHLVASANSAGVPVAGSGSQADSAGIRAWGCHRSCTRMRACNKRGEREPRVPGLDRIAASMAFPAGPETNYEFTPNGWTPWRSWTIL